MNMSEDLELIYEYFPEARSNDIGFEDWIDRSNFTEREFLAIVLDEVTDLSGEDRAEVMGVSEGRYWGCRGRAKEKLESSETTLDLMDELDYRMDQSDGDVAEVEAES